MKKQQHLSLGLFALIGGCWIGNPQSADTDGAADIVAVDAADIVSENVSDNVVPTDTGTDSGPIDDGASDTSLADATTDAMDAPSTDASTDAATDAADAIVIGDAAACVYDLVNVRFDMPSRYGSHSIRIAYEGSVSPSCPPIVPTDCTAADPVGFVYQVVCNIQVLATAPHVFQEWVQLPGSSPSTPLTFGCHSYPDGTGLDVPTLPWPYYTFGTTTFTIGGVVVPWQARDNGRGGCNMAPVGYPF